MFSSDSCILIVDDMATTRRLTVYQLGVLGYRNVEQAANGQQALDLILKRISEDNPVGLVISDWNMPVISGIELLEIIRKSRTTTNLPFMLVTAEDERTQVMRALKSRVNDYLIKPIDKTILEQKLQLLEKQSKSLKIA